MFSEKHYQTKLCDILRQNEICILEEVPYKRKRIDLVHLHNKKITCIEVKLNNWRKAIDQASINNLFCDESFIALPEERIHNIDETLLEKLNIGLISIKRNNYEIIKKPVKNRFKIKRYYQKFRSVCEHL